MTFESRKVEPVGHEAGKWRIALTESGSIDPPLVVAPGPGFHLGLPMRPLEPEDGCVLGAGTRVRNGSGVPVDAEDRRAPKTDLPGNAGVLYTVDLSTVKSDRFADTVEGVEGLDRRES
ncbi:hypothetical protein ACIQV3_12030 [Streptomyces sp. NPDC099050]|uniref:hypothetical protein n=1 Tax=Streptomyces sp. NPDC099050 TaxID=3366100 RepID=UPI00382681F6